MANITSPLTPAQTIALNKAVASEAHALRHNGETQTHCGSVAVIIDYTFNMGADETYTPTISTPLKAVLALLSEESPEMMSKVMNALNEAHTLKAEAELGNTDAEARLKALLKNAPQATANVDEALQALPKSVRQGKVHGVEVEVTALNAEVAKEAIKDYANKVALEAEAESNKLKALLG
jgi:hypothetical protein